MRFLYVAMLMGLSLASLCPAQGIYGRPQMRRNLSNSLGPDVPSPKEIVEKMLVAAQLQPGETVYDLGCGEGRVLVMAAKQFRAKAVGVEIDEMRYREALDAVRSLNLQDMISVIHGDMRTVDLSPADVVTLYLLTASNDLLRPLLEQQLKPGARVVSHDFEVRGWKPAVRTKTRIYNREHSIYVYKMPATR